jgi:Cytochrome c7 and related cytochrome c
VTFGFRQLWRTAASALLLAIVCALAAAACGADAGPQVSSAVFTPAHATVAEATRDFFGVRPRAEQPIPFPHKTHIEKGLTCTDYCHESVTKGPIAGLPSVKTCMICHDAIATDRPLIQQITEIQKTGRDLAWQRVYGYSQHAHVRFNHAPHIRASVDCATCHGKIAEQTVAERNVDLTMGFCVNCHRQKNASNDCWTCHF